MNLACRGALLASAILALVPAARGQNAAAPRVGKTLEQSTPYPMSRPHARPGAPNVLVWMIDDVGFGQVGCFGGLVETPNIDRVAAQGLRYGNYHTTPICSASRASFLTGRNSHTVHVGGHSAMAIGFPGQDARIPRAAGTIAENLRQAGYATYQIGKWDHLPPRDASAAGPFTYWPSGQGFDRAYSFLSYDANNFAPSMWRDHQPATVPADTGYHLSRDMADIAIDWIGARQASAPRAPFFLYWATGAAHSPHHAPQRWLDHYRGRFDEGWDVARARILARQKRLGIVDAAVGLPPRPDGMPAWDALSPDRKRMYARQMEAFAASLSYADEEFGRILTALETTGERDNTMVVVVTDNGASAEGAPEGTFSEFYMANGRFASLEQNLSRYDRWGGPDSYPLYAMGWAAAGNTPFRYYKQTAYEGGTRVPLVISWPRGIAARGEIRRQYQHVSDLAPTILDAVKAAPATRVNGEPQMPFDGVSMAPKFDDRTAPSAKHVQYYEMYGNRAIWHDGWKAVVPHRLKTWDFATQPPIADAGWELYDLRADPGETRDLAATQPSRLRRLVAAFDAEARRYDVYPLTNTGAAQALVRRADAAALAERGGAFDYVGAVDRIPEVLAPPIHTHGFTMTQTIQDGQRATGPLFAMGGRFGGLGLYLRRGVPLVAFRSIDGTLSTVSAGRAVGASSTVGLSFRRIGTDAAEVALTVDGKEAGAGRVAGPLSVYLFSSNETFDIGSDTGTPVLPDDMPARIAARIGRTSFRIDLPPADAAR